MSWMIVSEVGGRALRLHVGDDTRGDRGDVVTLSKTQAAHLAATIVEWINKDVEGNGGEPIAIGQWDACERGFWPVDLVALARKP